MTKSLSQLKEENIQKLNELPFTSSDQYNKMFSLLLSAIDTVAQATYEAIKPKMWSQNPKDYGTVEDYGMALGTKEAIQELESKYTAFRGSEKEFKK